MSRFHNAFNANAFDFSLNVFSEKAFENAFCANAFSKAFNANTATFSKNSNAFNDAHANALSMMNMHTLVC